MALGMWFVPLSTVLDAHGLHAIKPYAFATSAISAFVSPLLFGAMADRHLGPVRVLRGLAVATALAMALATTGIHLGWNAWLVLGLIQVHALFSTPTWSISTSIVLSRLTDSRREFGPIRAIATFGWMVGCWLVSALNADASTLAGYGGAITWGALAFFTLKIRGDAPPKSTERLTLKQRFGLDALALFKKKDHQVVFITAALFSIPIAAFYPFTPSHLKAVGFEHTSAWMAMGQVTEIIAMIGLARILTNYRLKWIFATGMSFGLIRFGLCALNTKATLLAGVTLHGFAFTLFFITAQLYLDERVDPAWRARAQALMSLMTAGVGNLIGYLSCGWWFNVCETQDGMRWTLFWGVLSGAIGAVLVYFLARYHGVKGHPPRPNVG
ncbi:MAG: MFS transporter [Verrucomicrobia bacterium]|nr:MFS transporter [Verrucomicrobiota bacterium]